MSALLLGLSLGFASGISPGPMLVLVLTTALQWGARHGVAVAAAPLLSDVPIVALSVFTLGRLPGSVVAGMGVVGGLFIATLGVQAMRDSRTASLDADPASTPPTAWSALRKGAAVNLLNPHPWLAWITAFGPLTLTTWRESPPAALLWLVGFYVALIGAKALIAVLVAGGRQLLTPARYRVAVLLSGLALAVLGAVMVVEFATALRSG